MAGCQRPQEAGGAARAPVHRQPVPLEAQGAGNVLPHKFCLLRVAAAAAAADAVSGVPLTAAHKCAQAPIRGHVTRAHEQLSAKMDDGNVAPATPFGALNPACSDTRRQQRMCPWSHQSGQKRGFEG